jgi:hypothetical protein
MPRNSEDDEAPVEIYEDPSGDEKGSPEPGQSGNAAASFMTQVADSFSSDLSDPQSDGENDPYEENDAILHSFGPLGTNVSNRFGSFSTVTPRKPAATRNRLADVLESSPLPPSEPLDPSDKNANASSPHSAATPASLTGLSAEMTETITNHVINQLAFSRLSSTPLSTIMNNLPTEERKSLSKDQLRIIIESTACVGIIRRQGKDAAGKPLESEYYYTPELDTDEQRRLAVTDGLRKPTLRNCRKQHKVSLPNLVSLCSSPAKWGLTRLVCSNIIGSVRAPLNRCHVSAGSSL